MIGYQEMQSPDHQNKNWNGEEVNKQLVIISSTGH